MMIELDRVTHKLLHPRCLLLLQRLQIKQARCALSYLLHFGDVGG